MANKRYDQFTTGTPTTSRIVLHADPSTGDLRKCAISEVLGLQNTTDQTLLTAQLLGSPIIATAMNLPVWMNTTTNTLVNGTAIYQLIYIPNCTVTGIWFVLSAPGTYTANNYNGFGLYSISGSNLNLVDNTPNDGNIWKTSNTTFGQKAFTTPLTFTAGAYYIALVWSASAVTSAPIIHANTSNFYSTFRFVGIPSQPQWIGSKGSTTVLPSTITQAAITSFPSLYPRIGIY